MPFVRDNIPKIFLWVRKWFTSSFTEKLLQLSQTV